MTRATFVKWTVAGALALAAFAPASSARAGGTRSLAQLHGGVALTPTGGSDVSLAWGLLMGHGGRLRGTHLRFYGLLAFDRVSFTDEGVSRSTGQQWTAERASNDLQAGLRVLLPVWWRLRWYVDLFVGASYLQGHLEWIRTTPFETSRWSGLLTGATGLEVRWHHNFATGIRGEVRWSTSDDDVIPPIAGREAASSLRYAVVATQVFLF